MTEKKEKKLKKKLSKINSSILGRSLTLAKLATQSSLSLAKNQIQNALTLASDPELKSKNWKALLLKQAELISKDLGELKGSLMKVGQALSMYGEHFLPAEANEFLKTLQYQSPPLAWEQIEKVLIEELGAERLSELEIEKESLASASLGQVHKALIKETQQSVVLKIQYPGVAAAVESDIKAIKLILGILNLLPKEFDTTPLFEEVKLMLIQELDYIAEAQATQKAFNENKKDPLSKIIIPNLFLKYCSGKVICSEYLEGFFIDSLEVQNLSQERRNNLSLIFLDHYFNEFINWGFIQTDPHIGNYKIHIGSSLNEDKIISLDFGATREFSIEYRKIYSQFLSGCLNQNTSQIERAAIQMGFLLKEDPQSLKDLFFEFCITTMEPYHSTIDNYDWHQTDLPERLSRIMLKIIKGYPLRTPPKESLFLDRKTGGVFIILKVLRVKIIARPVIEKYLKEEY